MRIALSSSRKRRRSLRRLVRGLVLVSLLALLLVCGLFYALRFPQRAERFNYPLQYEALIAQYAAEYALEEPHVAAVILCESSFRPSAVSSAGARGLMQLMPDTGEWIARKLGERDAYDHERLFEPELNVRYGCWYLRYLLDVFDGDRTKATAAYHAGANNVKKWLQDSAYSPDGTTLSATPFDATNTYIAKVNKSYEKYVQLYAQRAEQSA